MVCFITYFYYVLYNNNPATAVVQKIIDSPVIQEHL